MPGGDAVGPKQPPGPIADLDEIRDLLGRAAGGDQEALPELYDLGDRAERSAEEPPAPAPDSRTSGTP